MTRLAELLFLLILISIATFAAVSAEEVKQATGKILVYKVFTIDESGKITGGGLAKVTVLIVNDNEIYVAPEQQGWLKAGYFTYDPATNTLTFFPENLEESFETLSAGEAEIFVRLYLLEYPVLPKSLVEKLPSLSSLKITAYVITANGVETGTVEVPLSGFTIKGATYNGIAGIEIKLAESGHEAITFVREDGIRIYTKYDDVSRLQLLIEDDISKSKQPTTPPTTTTTTQPLTSQPTTSSATSSAMPTTSPTAVSSSPAATSAPTQTSIPSTTTTGAQEGLPLTYIAVGMAVAVIVAVVVVLKKLL